MSLNPLPVQATTAYVDRFWGLGEEHFELMRGYDCPYDGTLVGVVLWSGGKPVVRKNAICIFEQEVNAPASRHYELGDPYRFYGSTKGVALTIRAIASA